MPEKIQHERNDVCLSEFDTIRERLDKMEQKDEKRVDEINLVSKAIVEIQISSRITADTLAKLEQRFESLSAASADKWFKLIEKGLLILAGVIGALLGTKII